MTLLQEPTEQLDFCRLQGSTSRKPRADTPVSRVLGGRGGCGLRSDAHSLRRSPTRWLQGRGLPRGDTSRRHLPPGPPPSRLPCEGDGDTCSRAQDFVKDTARHLETLAQPLPSQQADLGLRSPGGLVTTDRSPPDPSLVTTAPWQEAFHEGVFTCSPPSVSPCSVVRPADGRTHLGRSPRVGEWTRGVAVLSSSLPTMSCRSLLHGSLTGCEEMPQL